MTSWTGDADRPETYFTALADGYRRHRPGYPPEAIAAALDGIAAPARVADVGCGTGIASRLFAAAGARVVGVEPNEAMLAQARAAPPPEGAAFAFAPEYRVGSAEATGLPEASADVVACAQAFHWFEAAPALAEFRRVLRPGGRVALIWNVRDDDAPAAAAYQAIMDRAQRAAETGGRTVARNRDADPTEGGAFANARELRFANAQRYDREGLLGRARSCSYFPADGPLRDELEAALDALFAEHARDGVVTLPHFCRVVLADRVGG